MAQTGYTPISLYYSSSTGTTPTAGNLVAGELAINTFDGKLFYKDSSGVVQTLASAAGNSGTFSNVTITGGTISGTAISPRVVVIADATSVTINGNTTDIATQANTQAVGTLTINAPTGTPANGQRIMFRLTSTNVQTFSWNAAFAGSTDLVLPAVSSGGGLTDYVGFIYNSTASKWQLVSKVFGF
jgi:hypothetical protein